jgi:hypothetical protein
MLEPVRKEAGVPLREYGATAPLRETFTSSASSIVSLRNRVSCVVLSDELVRVLCYSTAEGNANDRSICLVWKV